MNFNYYSLVIFPDIDNEKINSFRKRFDPLVDTIGFHITLIFPVKVPREIKEVTLIEHIQSIADRWKTFDLEIRGLALLWDNWLCLAIEEGNPEIIKLHDELYSGTMNLFWRKDIEFIPHIAIGSFSKEGYDLRDPKKLELDKDKYEIAKEEAEKLDIGYSCKAKKMSLVQLNSELKDCKLIKEFLLK